MKKRQGITEATKQDERRRLLTDRTFRGHFSLSLPARTDFQEFCENLDENLRINCGRHHQKQTVVEGGTGSGVGDKNLSEMSKALLWTEFQDYGVQESIFFHDLDLNEIEVSYWLSEEEIAQKKERRLQEKERLEESRALGD